MRGLRFSAILLLLAASFPQFVWAQTQNTAETPNQTQKEQQFDDWKISCPDNAPCRMAQSIVSSSNNQAILQLRIFKGNNPTALFSFPLGILLNTGWQIQVDSKKPRILPFEICKLDGCHSGINLTPTLINNFKRGNTLKVKIFDAKQNPIEPKISLKGFTKAWEALE